MIGKFSNTCIISSPSIESFEVFNADVKISAVVVMKNVINRLLRQGVVNYNMLSDTSLNVEVFNYLKENSIEYPNTVTVYDSLPPTMRKYWLDNFATNGRLDLIFHDNQAKAQGLSLTEIEAEIYKVLDGDIKVQHDKVSNETKYKVVRAVYALTAMNREVTDENIKSVKNILTEAFFLIGMPQSVFKESIMRDIDSHYEEASKYILEASNKRGEKMMYNKQETGAPSEIKKGILGAIAMMKAKTDRLKEQEGSKMEFDFSEDAFEIVEELTDEDLKSTRAYVPMNEIFSSSESLYESFVLGDKFEEFSALEKLSEKYAVGVLQEMCVNNNLLINFYLQTTDKKYKALSQQEGNKFCLNVDLKTGEVDLTLKGQSFKLSPFFPNNEEVKTNAHEW